jgi:hypothetical protein
MPTISDTLNDICSCASAVNTLDHSYLLSTAHSFNALKGRLRDFTKKLQKAENPETFGFSGWVQNHSETFKYVNATYKKNKDSETIQTLQKLINKTKAEIELNKTFAQQFAEIYTCYQGDYTSSPWELFKETITRHKVAICKAKLTASEIAVYARNNPNSRTAKVWEEVRNERERQYIF